MNKWDWMWTVFLRWPWELGTAAAKCQFGYLCWGLQSLRTSTAWLRGKEGSQLQSSGASSESVRKLFCFCMAFSQFLQVQMTEMHWTALLDSFEQGPLNLGY